MGNKEALEHLEYALKSVLCNGLEGIDKSSMEFNIELFIRDVASHYSSEELIAKFYTPEETIAAFMAYLEKCGALDDSGMNTIQ